MDVRDALFVLLIFLCGYLLAVFLIKLVLNFRVYRFRSWKSASFVFGFSAVCVSGIHSPVYANPINDTQQVERESDPWLNSDVHASIPTSTAISDIQGSNNDVSEEFTPDGSENLTKYVVQSGDNLWSIAQNSLKDGHEIISRWKQIIDTNKGSLVSGNPDLIYPGEEIILPN